MLLDSLGRRLRTKRQPRGDTHRLTPRDITWLAFIHRHGGRLPTSYIHNLTSKGHKTLLTTQRRLKVLFNEMGLLSRPWQQQETIDPRYNELVHEVSEKGIVLLKEEGLFSPYAPSPHGAFKHQVMLSCISASFELAGFNPQHTILEPKKHSGRFTLTDGVLAPDVILGIEDLTLFLEVDRGTEVTSTQNFNRKSWTRTIRQYRELIGYGKYKEDLQVSGGALLLIVTVSRAKVEGILKVIAQEYPNGCNYCLVTHMPEFGRTFHPPKIIDIHAIEWRRHGHSNFKL